MTVSPEETRAEFERLKKDAEDGGYLLNPDPDFTLALVEGLIVNTRRYGYPSCPCRLTGGSRDADRDIICPCDYRDPDLDEYGACYCGLYVSQDILEGKKKARSIPERRPPARQSGFLDTGAKEKKMDSAEKPGSLDGGTKLAYPVWRCNVCGYLCARDNPPEVCPVCKAKKERFSRFL